MKHRGPKPQFPSVVPVLCIENTTTASLIAACPTHAPPSSCILPRLASPPLYSTACLAGAAIGKEFNRAKGVQARGRVSPGGPLAARTGRARGRCHPPRTQPVSSRIAPRRHVLAVVPSRAARHVGLQVLGMRNGNGPIRRPRSARSATASPRLTCGFPTWPPRRPARSELASPEVITYDLTVRHSATQPDVLGGGLEFVLDMKSPYFQDQKPPDSVLLPDNTGWSWPLGPDREVKVVFTPAVKKVYFENNNKGRIRAFFVGESNSGGTDKLTITITLPQRDRAQTDRGRGIRPRSRARGSPTSSPTRNLPSISPRSTISRGRTGFCARRATASSSRTARRPASGAST